MFWPIRKYLTYDSIFSDRIHELLSSIPVLRHAVTTLPRASPLRIRCIRLLAIALEERYYLLRQVDDLEQSILNFTEAIFLPPNRYRPNIAEYLFSTVRLLHFRAVISQQPEDVKYTVIYLRYLRGLSPEALNIPLDIVKEILVLALALQVGLELGDVMQDIVEMADLFLELFNSDISTILTRAIIIFAGVVKDRYGSWGKGKGPPAKVIDCLRKARIRLPNLDELSITFAGTLFERYLIAYSNDDCEEGTAILDRFLTSHDPADDPSQYRAALHLISMFALVRLTASQRPENLEGAIFRFRNWLLGISPEDPFRPYVAAHLKHLQSMHFEDFGVGALQEEDSLDSLFSGLPSFWDVIASLGSPSMETKLQRILALGSTLRMTDMAEIEKAIEPCRRLVASFHPSDMDKPVAVNLFGELLRRAFSLTNNVEYLNEAISTLREGLKLPCAEHFRVVLKLIHVLFFRFNLRRSREDFDEIMQLFQMAVNHIGTKIPNRFVFSCRWARFARLYGHPSTSTAYDCALSLMQDSLTLAPTVDIQHSRLVAMRGDYETLPLACASYQVHTGHLQSAVETLERGRALIWSEMRGLRPSIDQLRASDPDVADKLTAINQDLEDLTLAFAQNSYDDDGGEEGLEGMGPFGRLVVRQQGLLNDRDNLISQIRARKGFESLLKPPSFDHVRSAAVRGPVIVINHCRWRSDIIILLRDSPPSLIFTSEYFYDRANKLRDQLLGAKNKGLESVEYEDALRYVLKELYELVGRPVIQRLNELQVPAQSRVWWCPTSAFCSLPLHAMGPIPSDSGPQYFLDLYIPSYTPTLSALIESNKSGSQTLGKPSLLLVGQPDEYMKAAWGEMRAVQSVNTQVKTLTSARATPTAVLKRLQDHGFVHIVCHGILEPGKPFDSSFKLYGGNRLTLMNIIRSRLPNAEFAFLAACHTAELTDGSLSDEALHLAAAMQYCGFRSVVGTMWAMADEDGRHLAQSFYESVFPVGESQGVCYYERTAEALRGAVINLRSRTSLERWVNFVHYGA